MIPLSITLDSGRGVTVLSNVFIDSYMSDANEIAIKVYLYLLRMVGANLPTDISEIATKFGHSKDEVNDALKYWSDNHLVSLSYDDAGEIVGIAMKDLTKAESIVKKSPSTDVIKEDIPMISMDYAAEKANYSLDDIKALENNSEAKMLLNISSQYFGRPLSPTEIRSLLFIYDRLAFSLDLADYLVEYCADNGKMSIHYIDQVAINWYEAGIKTVSAAKKFTKEIRADKKAYAVMKELGKQNEPTLQELDYIKKWYNVYGFTTDIISEACRRTVLATDKNRFQYADSILKSWNQNNVHKKSDIAALDESFISAKNVKTASILHAQSKESKKPSVTFCTMEEQDYDFDMLEKAGRKHS